MRHTSTELTSYTRKVRQAGRLYLKQDHVYLFDPSICFNSFDLVQKGTSTKSKLHAEQMAEKIKSEMIYGAESAKYAESLE